MGSARPRLLGVFPSNKTHESRVLVLPSAPQPGFPAASTNFMRFNLQAWRIYIRGRCGDRNYRAFTSDFCVLVIAVAHWPPHTNIAITQLRPCSRRSRFRASREFRGSMFPLQTNSTRESTWLEIRVKLGLNSDTTRNQAPPIKHHHTPRPTQVRRAEIRSYHHFQ